MNSPDKIRILHVTEASNAGVGGHVLDLMEGLQRYQCEVHLAYSPDRTDDFFRDRMQQMPPENFTAIPMKRAPDWSDMSASRSILRCIRKLGPFDIIHAHSTKAGGICRIGSIRRQARVIYTPNGIYSMNPGSPRLARKLVQIAERKLANRGDLVIAVSPEEEEHMVEFGIPRQKIRMVPNGLRPIRWSSRASIREQLGLSDDQLLFGFLGRLAPQKNPLLLIRAFAEIRDARANLGLAMVGVGPLEPECRKLAAELGVARQIHWLGYKTAPQAMPAFDVFVMPSRYEGMPYVMMEAISCGLPVIATPVGGTRLGIESGWNGLVTGRDSPGEMAEALRRLLNDQVRKSMSSAARVKSGEFSLDLMVRRTLGVYRECMGMDSDQKTELRNEPAMAPGR